MYTKTQKTKNKIFLLIITIIIILTIFILCIQTTSRYNIIDRLIIAGRNIGKNDVTTTYNNFENLKTQFEWTKDVNLIVMNEDDDGKQFSISRAMNTAKNSPKNNVCYYIPENIKGHQIQSFILSFTTSFSDAIISTGMLLRLKKEDNTLHGYMLSFNNDWKDWTCDCEPDYKNFNWYDECGGKSVAIWKFSCSINSQETEEEIIEKWNNGDYSNGIQKTLVKAIDYDFTTRENYIVTSTPNQIIIQDAEYSEHPEEDGSLYQNITKIDITSDDEIGDGYGFFVNTCYHNHENYGGVGFYIADTYITQL